MINTKLIMSGAILALSSIMTINAFAITALPAPGAKSIGQNQKLSDPPPTLQTYTWFPGLPSGAEYKITNGSDSMTGFMTSGKYAFYTNLPVGTYYLIMLVQPTDSSKAPIETKICSFGVGYSNQGSETGLAVQNAGGAGNYQCIAKPYDNSSLPNFVILPALK